MKPLKGALADPLAQFLIGVAVGALGGHLANSAYNSSTPREKREWARNRIMHHGTLGCMTAATGVASANPFLTGAGTGLALTDLPDISEWFSEKQKRNV
jgi:hypothetical protein